MSLPMVTTLLIVINEASRKYVVSFWDSTAISYQENITNIKPISDFRTRFLLNENKISIDVSLWIMFHVSFLYK